MKLEGITDKGDTWEQSYEYIKFRPFLDEDREIFEVKNKTRNYISCVLYNIFFKTPIGVYCPGRKPTKPLPKIPPHFSFRIEATSTDLNITVNQAVRNADLYIHIYFSQTKWGRVLLQLFTNIFLL
jgi:hypothetical protein